MPAHRKPTKLLELGGAFRKNPQRRLLREHEPVPRGVLGDPPRGFSARERAAWYELKELALPGVLSDADRWIVEVCARLMANLRKHGIGGPIGLNNGQLAQLMQGLARLGMTPADRSRVSATLPSDKSKNRFAEFVDDNSNNEPGEVK